MRCFLVEENLMKTFALEETIPVYNYFRSTQIFIHVAELSLMS